MRRSLVLAVLTTLVAAALALVVSPPGAHAAGCTSLDPADLRYGAPAIAGTVNYDSAPEVCYLFEEAAETVVHIGTLKRDFNVELLDSQGSRICGVALSAACRLPGGQITMRVWPAGLAGDVPFEIQIFRLTGDTECQPLGRAAFGSTSGGVAEGSLRHGQASCFGIDLSQGRHHVSHQTINAEVAWTLYDASGGPVCKGTGPLGCEVASAGRHSLVYVGSSRDWPPLDFKGAVVDLASTTGCRDGLATGWESAPTSVQPADLVQVDCHWLAGNPGDRVAVDAERPAVAVVVDRTGQVACTPSSGALGCSLVGLAPFRLVSSQPGNQSGPPSDYDLVARDVGPTSDCPTIALQPFGAAPQDHRPGVGCRQFDVQAGQTVFVRAVYGEDWSGYLNRRIYDQAGRSLCATEPICTFADTGRVLMVTNLFRSTLLTALHDVGAAPGCLEQVSDLTVRNGDLGGGQFDCSLLDEASGARLKFVQGGGVGPAEVHVVDAKGKYQCDGSYWNLSCDLAGVAPFRAIVGRESAYRLAILRLGDSSRCAPLDRSSYGASDGAVVARLDDAHFARCYHVPATGRDTGEVISYAKSAGEGTALLSVHGGATEDTCSPFQGSATNGALPCSPRPANAAYTVLLTNRGTTADFEIRRYAEHLDDPGCASAQSRSISGPGTRTSTAGGAVLACVDLTAESAERYWIADRDEEGSASTLLFAASEGLTCNTRWTAVCLVTGSSGYRMVTTADGKPVDATIDTWRLSDGTTYSPDCVDYGDYSDGFGPTVATLSDEKPGLCVVLKDGGNDTYSVDVTDTSDGSRPITPVQVQDSSEFTYTCDNTGPWSCSNFASNHTQTGLLIVPKPANRPEVSVRLSAGCASSPPCGDIFHVAGASPTAAPVGSTPTVTITGRRLGAGSSVWLSREGHERVYGTNLGPSSSTQIAVRFDLSNAAPGAWRLNVAGPIGLVGTAPAEFWVTLPSLRSTTRPTVSGTGRVDSVLKASAGTWTATPTSYAYRWYANGAPISGATASSYKLTAKYLGKSITVAVTAKRSGWLPGTSTSAGKKVALGAAPVVVKKPTVTGTRRVGSRVTATKGTWSKAPSSYAYQWYVAGRKVAGATRPSLLLTKGMRGKQVKVVVTARRTGCASGTASSQPFTVR